MKFLLLVIMLCFVGCSHYMTLRQDSSPEEFYKANNQARTYRATVILEDGTQKRGHSVNFNPDTVKVHEIESDVATVLRRSGIKVTPLVHWDYNFEQISRVRIYNDNRGARDGFFVGLLAGLAIGSAVNRPVWEDPETIPSENLLYLVICSTAGALIGSFVSSATIVRFDHPVAVYSRR